MRVLNVSRGWSASAQQQRTAPPPLRPSPPGSRSPATCSAQSQLPVWRRVMAGRVRTGAGRGALALAQLQPTGRACTAQPAHGTLPTIVPPALPCNPSCWQALSITSSQCPPSLCGPAHPHVLTLQSQLRSTSRLGLFRSRCMMGGERVCLQRASEDSSRGHRYSTTGSCHSCETAWTRPGYEHPETAAAEEHHLTGTASMQVPKHSSKHNVVNKNSYSQHALGGIHVHSEHGQAIC